MTLRAMSFASGELATTEAVLYTALALKRTIVNVNCFNRHTLSATVTIKVRRAGEAARIVVRQALGADETLTYGPVELSEGDAILGLTSVARVVDYTLSGYAEVVA